jgi:3-phosphoshikimate 1-carboxyvinyltransferase
MALPDPLPIEPIAGPLDADVRLPGSKSLTNRALVCAALADGTSELTGALEADDTLAMVDGLRSLGVAVEADWPAERLVVHGCHGRPPAELAIVDARLSGTTSRFLAPMAALRALAVTVTEVGAPGHLPIEVSDGPVAGGPVRIPGDTSSQFASGLLLAGPAMRTGLLIHIPGPLVSQPYLDMTVAVMAAFGVDVVTEVPQTWSVPPGAYRATHYAIEPDASAASYAFAAAAIVGGRVTVAGLGARTLQGDHRFVDLLARMGAEVDQTDARTTVRGTGTLHGIEADLSQISDVAQTLAVVAAFADSPTRVTGIGFIRGKETDRVGNVVAELRRAGIDAEEEADGYVVRPGPVGRATIATYDDHRMAMAFALLGLRAPGIRIADPGCVAKTFPGYWAMLQGLRDGGPAPTRVPAS